MLIRTRAFVAALAAVGALSTAACREDHRTDILLDLHTTIACARLQGVVVAVMSAPGAEEHTLAADHCEDGSPDATIGTVSIVPADRDDAALVVRVVAGVDRPVAQCTSEDRWAGCVVARRALRFVPKRQLDLPIVLRTECVGVGCDVASTCVAGECRSASVPDPAACVGGACDESVLQPSPPASIDGGAADGAPRPSDAGADVVTTPPDGGPSCASDEKLCWARCVARDDPQYGCLATGCTPCPDMATTAYTCANDACAPAGCKPGFKRCGAGCVPADAAHGCEAQSCAPCDATNGTATCSPDAQGKLACAIECAAGFKRCGGKCVNVNDPTYGCSATGCSAQSCPVAGAGTLACVNGACVIGSCPAGTKNCGQKCVPTDAQNGCEDGTRCAPCGVSEACAGTPRVCTCVPESPATTCAGKRCGTATNNCGQVVHCPNKCTAPDVCGGGGAGPNGCGCTSDPACVGMNCGAYYDNCGRAVSCGSCAWPDFCGGGGGNVCGAPPEGDCGPNWPSMGDFWCDGAGLRHQTICGCHPLGYADPQLWEHDGDCYSHMTGDHC